MTDTANHLQCVEQSPEPKIPDHGENDEAPHNQRGVPSLRRVRVVVENHKALNHTGKVSRAGCGSCYPGKNRHPSCTQSASTKEGQKYKITLKQAPEPWFEGGKRCRPAILCTDHGVSGSLLAGDSRSCHLNPHRGHFCKRQGDHGRANAREQASVNERGGTTVQQAELKRYTRCLPCCLQSKPEVDNGCWIDISLHRHQLPPINTFLSRLVFLTSRTALCSRRLPGFRSGWSSRLSSLTFPTDTISSDLSSAMLG
jgi:hypothetical protein